ncbi:MAG TPA: N-6 DNA methylase, partial [bacterium]|nr:N-6 DNA methylase [bacterium]
MLDNETRRRIDSARDILVGKVPDPKSQVEQITIALIYKFMDDMDREAVEMGGKATFFTGEYEKYGWSQIFNPRLGGYEMLALYADAITRMTQNPGIPQLFRDIFKNAYLPYRDPETLKLFLKTVDEFRYDHSERLGDAFEYLLSVLGSQGDAGQFRTPRHIIDFMVEIVDPKKHETILDPACGTAGFLVSAYKHILNANTSKRPGDLLNPEERNRLLVNFKGYDISPDMVRISLVNLYLHGFVQPQIYEYDTLSREERWSDYADVVLANPPFMSPKGGIKPHKRFTVQSNRSEVLFVDYIAEHLTPAGRGAVIVPEGIIFQSAGAYRQLRKYLIEENFLVAVISLPAGVFNPYSGVKTSILVFDRGLARKASGVLFLKIQNDGYGLGAQRRQVAGSELPEAAGIMREWFASLRSAASFSASGCGALVVEKSRLAENGEYNLTGERYREVVRRGGEKWERVRLGEICDFINGRAFKPADWKDQSSGGLPIIRIQNLNNQEAKFNYYSGAVEDRYLVNKGNLLFSWSGSRGTSFGAHIWQGGRGILNQHIFRVEFDDRCDKEYLCLILNRAVSVIEENLHGGVGLVHITKGNLEKIQIPLPPIEIQREIVAEIEEYQKIIDGARQVVESWKPKIELDPSWTLAKLSDVCEINPKKSQIPSINSDIPVSFLPMEDIGMVQDIIPRKESQLNLVYKGYTYFRENDILIAKVTPCFENGKSGIARKLLNGIGFGSSELHVIRCSSKVLPEFVYPYISSEKFLLAGKIQMTGTGGLQRVPAFFISAFEIPLPRLSVQREIVTKIEAERKIVDGCRELIALYE